MACDTLGSWAHYAAGLGLERPFTEDDARDLIAFYDQHERAAEVQVTPYQHESLLGVLAERDFKLSSVEHVLARDSAKIERAPEADSQLEFVKIDPTDKTLMRRFADAHFAAFYGDEPVPDGARPILTRVIEHPRVALWLVERNGETVASGGLETFENSAVLICGGVLPAHRRQGIQQALIDYRVRAASELGCNYSLIASTAGGPTERNALRSNFQPAFTQLTMRKPVPG